MPEAIAQENINNPEAEISEEKTKPSNVNIVINCENKTENQKNVGLVENRLEFDKLLHSDTRSDFSEELFFKTDKMFQRSLLLNV